MSSETKKQVVLVTGSSGCLGQHIVKQLHENDDTVGHIRCYDIKEYRNNLKHKMVKEVDCVTGDIRDQSKLAKAMAGVDVVIHCAAKVDLSLDPNAKELYSVNVEGTQKVIDACIECNVPYLIYISGSDVAVGSDPIYYGSENTTVIPKKHLLGPYSKTKYEAEQIVLESNKRSLANGGKLITLALRPTLIYGEEDKHFLTKMLSIAKSYSGVLRRVDNIFVRGHPVYAGNVATACLQAMNKMQQDPNLGGEQFFITDDTRIVDPFEFFDPYLKARGFQLSERQYPYWLFIMIFAFFTWFLKLFSMTNLLNLPSDLTPPIVRYICNTYFFNRNKATLRLDYEPAFNHDEAQERSMPYYKSVAI